MGGLVSNGEGAREGGRKIGEVAGAWEDRRKVGGR